MFALLPPDDGITFERIAILAIGALLGLLTREGWAVWKARQSSKTTLKTLLLVAQDEVQFYIGKLRQLETELSQFLTATQQGATLQFTPSYTVYPEFLEQQRRLMAEHGMSQRDVVRDLGHCAFELRHIAKRIADARTSQGSPLAVSDWSGTHGLVQANISTFEKMLTTLESQP